MLCAYETQLTLSVEYVNQLLSSSFSRDFLMLPDSYWGLSQDTILKLEKVIICNADASRIDI